MNRMPSPHNNSSNMQHRSSAGSASITSSKSGGNDNSNDDQASTSFLPKGFAPGENDIVIGRSMKYFNHSGNRALRSMVASRLEEYSEADKSEKSFIISEVMEQIKANSNTGAGFLKLDPASGLWYEVCTSAVAFFFFFAHTHTHRIQRSHYPPLFHFFLPSFRLANTSPEKKSRKPFVMPWATTAPAVSARRNAARSSVLKPTPRQNNAMPSVSA